MSHYYEELEQLADKLLILDQGRMIAYGTKDELFRKYCGSAIIILENNPKNRELSAGFVPLESPGHLLALSCPDRETEGRILSILLENNVNYKRSNSDIEIMSINAIRQYYSRRDDQ